MSIVLSDQEANQLVQNPRPNEPISVDMQRYIAAYQQVARRLDNELSASATEVQRLNEANTNLVTDLTTREQEVRRLQAELSNTTTP